MRGSPSALPATAPARVERFQSTKTDTPVTRKPSRAAAVDSRVTDIAVDSSISTCAARSPSRAAQAAAEPAAARRACCGCPAAARSARPRAGRRRRRPRRPARTGEAPVNISRDRAQVCQTVRPEATETAPKRDAVRARGEADAEAVADDRAPRLGRERCVGHPPEINGRRAWRRTRAGRRWCWKCGAAGRPSSEAGEQAPADAGGEQAGAAVARPSQAPDDADDEQR